MSEDGSKYWVLHCFWISSKSWRHIAFFSEVFGGFLLSGFLPLRPYQVLTLHLANVFLALILAIFVPSVNTMLDFVSAFATPMSTQIYPAVLYLTLFNRDEQRGLVEARQDVEECRPRGLSRSQAFGVRLCSSLGA